MHGLQVGNLRRIGPHTWIDGIGNLRRIGPHTWIGQITHEQVPEQIAFQEMLKTPEAAALEDALKQAGFLGAVSIDKEPLQKRAVKLDGIVRTCKQVPPALMQSYLAWRAQWNRYYNTDPPALNPLAMGAYARELKAHEIAFAEFLARFTEFCDVSSVEGPGGGAAGIPLGTIAIAGAVVFLGIAIVVASQIFGVTKGASGAIARGLERGTSSALEK
jgi:hypothetical protein